uniref:FHA domain-containing protein n=1 Tax=Trypanosoma congolense (strain IL3000) TaxID=1068625 RepID=G0UQC8_TRYCI|nr:conserved hypothetical protein [Trypanosoma congolense IL3000]
MTEYFSANLVLVRGPEVLQRRVSLRLPLNGTPVTVGRGKENSVVLETNLIFSSQLHCQFYVRKNTEDVLGKEERSTNCDSPSKEATRASCKRPREEAVEDQYSVCLIDMGSSNGTFVNGVRIKASVETMLRHGDAIVLGGMRDIEVGRPLPMADLPAEIVVWRLAVKDKDEEIFDFVATPPVYLRADFVEGAEKQLALELLRSQCRTDLAAVQSVNSSTQGSKNNEQPPPRKSDDVRGNASNKKTSTPSPATDEAIPISRSLTEGGQETARRSGTIAALVESHETNEGDAARALAFDSEASQSNQSLSRTVASGEAPKNSKEAPPAGAAKGNTRKERSVKTRSVMPFGSKTRIY